MLQNNNENKTLLEKQNYHFEELVAMTTVVLMSEKRNAMVIRAVKISYFQNKINSGISLENNTWVRVYMNKSRVSAANL